MNYLIHPQDDLTIDRSQPDVAIVLDGEGEEATRLPAGLSDQQIRMIVDALNLAYDEGYQLGKTARSLEIRRLLEM